MTGWFAQELADELTEPGFRCWMASGWHDAERVVLGAELGPRPDPRI